MTSDPLERFRLALLDEKNVEIERLRATNAELVEALKRAEAFLLGYHGLEDQWICNDIRAAIAKAKGET